jgi:hypothetical protein
LVIVGNHAPPINPYKNEFSCYFRETQRAANENEIVSFLARSDPGIRYSPGNPKSLEKQSHPTWFPKSGGEGAPAYMKRGSVDDFLDYGVPHGLNNDLLKAAAGVGVARNADLVLSGHGHRRVDYRIEKNSNGELTYDMDFYTENPQSYYPIRFHKEWIGGGNQPNYPNTDMTYVRIVPGASENGRPKKFPNDGEYKYKLSVRPYANSLSKSNYRMDWPPSSLDLSSSLRSTGKS